MPHEHYCHPDDLHHVGDLISTVPEGSAFLKFQAVIDRDDGAVPPKVRELIAVAVALTTQCAYCLDMHTARARRAGVTREEIAEVAFVTAAVRAGGALGHALLALRLFDRDPPLDE